VGIFSDNFYLEQFVFTYSISPETGIRFPANAEYFRSDEFQFQLQH
jgi:hypothetical protein